MNRLIAALILAVLLAGCGAEEKKEPNPQLPSASQMFDNKAVPNRNAGKGAKAN
jgi:hypothetical protein